MRHGSIVDRQYLYGFLMGKYCPVYHLPEIAEVAYAEALFGAQREDGHGYSGTFPVGQGEVNVTVTNYQCFVSAYLRIGHVAVGVVLPCHGTMLFLIIKDEFVLQRETDFRGVYFDLPFREVGVAHQNGFIRVPISQNFLVAANAQAVVIVDARSIRFDH